MPFIGVICNKKNFQIIKSNLPDFKEIIHIDCKNIENFKNVKFDMIIINQELSSFKSKEEYLKKVLNNNKYLAINFDIKIQLTIFNHDQLNVISYGLNTKSTVTVSSIKEDEILIAIQRKIKNSKGEIIEEEEKKIDIKDNKKNNIYLILIINIIKIIFYDK